MLPRARRRDRRRLRRGRRVRSATSWRALVEELFGDWRTPEPVRARAVALLRPPGGRTTRCSRPTRRTPCCAAGINVRLRDDDADFPALVLANYLLGGSSTARMPGARAREGRPLLQHRSAASARAPSTRPASFRVARDLRAAEPRPRRERDPRGARARGDATASAPRRSRPASKALLEQRRLARTQDRALANRLGSYLFIEAHLRLGRRLRGENRRAHPGAGQRRAQAPASTPASSRWSPPATSSKNRHGQGSDPAARGFGRPARAARALLSRGPATRC